MCDDVKKKNGIKVVQRKVCQKFTTSMRRAAGSSAVSNLSKIIMKKGIWFMNFFFT